MLVLHYLTILAAGITLATARSSSDSTLGVSLSRRQPSIDDCPFREIFNTGLAKHSAEKLKTIALKALLLSTKRLGLGYEVGHFTAAFYRDFFLKCLNDDVRTDRRTDRDNREIALS